MNSLRCLIIDDEPVSRKIIREHIEDVDFLELCGEAETAIQAAQYVVDNHIDLIFLDVQLPGMTGIDFLRSSVLKPMTIITTAYPDYALQGFELDVLDYLVKPIAFDRFLKAASKAREFSYLRIGQADAGDSFYIKCDRKIEKIYFADIIYIEAKGNFIEIHTRSKKFITWLTFKLIETKLPAELFVRIHKSYIIALSAIARIDANKAVLPGAILPVSKHFRKMAMERINPYLLRRSV